MSDVDIKWSITNGDLEQVRKLVCEGVFSVNERIGFCTPLILAADFAQNEIIEFLIKNGADVNAVDSHGRTALLAAAWENHVETVKLLLSKGARKDLKAPDGSNYRDQEGLSVEVQQLLT